MEPWLRRTLDAGSTNRSPNRRTTLILLLIITGFPGANPREPKKPSPERK